jgi:DnaJ-class molecular chaperone
VTQRDYYEVLGVARDCGEPDLKVAYKKLAMEHHPDRNGGCEEASGRFKEINEAYSVLCNPQKRAAYDRFGHAGVNGSNGGGAGFNDVHDIFNEVFGQAFGDMFGAGRGRQNNGPARGQDLRYDLEITLEQAYAGAEVEISVPAAMACETCKGSGAKPGTSPTMCGTCNGAGRVRATQGFFSIERACPRCGGWCWIPAATAMATARFGANECFRCASRPVSMTAPASAFPARAIPAPAAGRAAISTSFSRSSRTSCSSVTGWICCAACRCRCSPQCSAAKSTRPACSAARTATAIARSR